ncbi:hypothetical protein MOMA_07161 [Moraxella macacae 0408225]|uniref:DUF7944 domain-containing protein n=1 Tax=Moraxella macacae 0408225 TaxID=1230338 RepID=L2F5L5_9GAMM|nr:hypothetical protein [Moraxella macacae]ELA08322.1 hypothetical protein MOMA_07161 [Moraxella macacae 0408225]
MLSILSALQTAMITPKPPQNKPKIAKVLLGAIGLSVAMFATAHDTMIRDTMTRDTMTDGITGNTIAIDMSTLATTKEEVAVLQVFSEICPPMLTKKQQQGFAKAYNAELKSLMPSISDPRLAVQYLSTQQDYKQILNETRRWTLSFSNAENKRVCTELASSAQ